MAQHPSIEERFDPAVAEQVLSMGHKMAGGLPGYLGIDLIGFEPGRLRARAMVT